MANLTLFAAYLVLLLGIVHCGPHSGDDDDDDGTGLTLGQYAAIGIGGTVILAVIIILVIAMCIKCNKKSKTQPEIGKHSDVVSFTPREGVNNKVPLYEDPPPMYSLRDQGPSNDVYLPPYSKSKPTDSGTL